MTRVLQRIFRRRGPSSDEPELESPQDEAGTQGTAPLPESGEEPGEEAADRHPSFRSRGAMRRRLRYLRRARELGFRDLGGLVFDLRRFERDRPDLVEAKVLALHEVDRELRTLERALDARQDIHELREPGIASCPRCGALHGSEARYCPSCGLALRGPQPMSEVGVGVPAVLGPSPRPQLPSAGDEAPPPPPEEPPRTPPVPARPGQPHDEPAPFGGEPEQTDEKPGDDSTRVLPPEDSAGTDGEATERRPRVDG